ncbi:response regulator [Megalodesulfovibrio paquesii]
MASLDALRTLGFAEQMRLLMEANLRLDEQDAPALLELAATPLGDAAVDAMARGVLRTLFLAHPVWISRALGHDNPQVQRAAVHAAASLNMQSPDAAQALADLVALARENARQTDVLLEVLTALAQLDLDALRAAGALPVFRLHLDHPEPLIAGVCLSMLGALQDCESLPGLAALLERSVVAGQCCSDLMCEAPLWNALDALGDLAMAHCPGALEVLAGHMRHPNATARRLVHDALAAQGERALPQLIAALENDADADLTIMAANLLGRIAHKRGVNAILDSLEAGRLASPTQRFAAYEALGRMPSLAGKMHLLSAWEAEADPAGCIALVHAIEGQFSPALAERFLAAVLVAAPLRQSRMIRALAAASAPELLLAMHQNPELRGLLVEYLLNEGTADALARHMACLQTLAGQGDQENQGDQGARDALARLSIRRDALPAAGTGVKLLAIDDSAAMRSFYLGVGAGLGMEVLVAEHGRHALDILESDAEGIQCLIVDMNMPVMDGVAFVRQLRAKLAFKRIPVVMATTESTVSQREQAMQAGVDEFLKKPFTMQALQSTIARLLHT